MLNPAYSQIFVFQLYVFFPDEVKVGVKTMKTYTNRMKEEGVHRAILVVQQNLTPFARTCVSEISTKFHLEVFQVIVEALLSFSYFFYIYKYYLSLQDIDALSRGIIYLFFKHDLVSRIMKVVEAHIMIQSQESVNIVY